MSAINSGSRLNGVRRRILALSRNRAVVTRSPAYGIFVRRAATLASPRSLLGVQNGLPYASGPVGGPWCNSRLRHPVGRVCLCRGERDWISEVERQATAPVNITIHDGAIDAVEDPPHPFLPGQSSLLPPLACRPPSAGHSSLKSNTDRVLILLITGTKS